MNSKLKYGLDSSTMTKLNKNKLSIRKNDNNQSEKVCLKKISTTILKNKLITQNQIQTMGTPSPSTSKIQEISENNSEDCRLKDSLTTQINIPTKNQFDVLEEEMDTDPITNNATKNIARNPSKSKNNKRPPAIVLHNNKILKHQDFTEITKTHAKNGFYVKNSKNNTNVYIRDEEEYKKYMVQVQVQVLEKQKIPFHTYTMKSEKTHSFIVKGIDSDPSTEEIQKDLIENYNIPVKSVYKLKTTRNIYAIHTDNSVYLRELRKKSKIRMLH